MEVLDVHYEMPVTPRVKQKFIPGTAIVLISTGPRSMQELEMPVLFVLAQPLERIFPIFFN